METKPLMDEMRQMKWMKLSMDWFSWENLNRKPWFLPSNCLGFPVKFPIIQFYETDEVNDR